MSDAMMARMIEAAKAMREEALRRELGAGADPNAADPIGRTALSYACAGGSEACAKALLEFGADPNQMVQMANEWTAGHFAAQKGHEGCLRRLLEAGLDPNRGGNGITPGHLAAQRGKEGCLRLLLEAGLDLAAKAGPMGRTPLESARGGARAAESAARVAKGLGAEIERSVMEDAEEARRCVELLSTWEARREAARERGLIEGSAESGKAAAPRGKTL